MNRKRIQIEGRYHHARMCLVTGHDRHGKPRFLKILDEKEISDLADANLRPGEYFITVYVKAK